MRHLRSILSSRSAADKLSLPPRSLLYDRPFDTAKPEVENSWIGRLLLRIGGYYGADSRRRRGANNLYDAVTEQAESSEFYRLIGLDRDAFAAVHNVLTLHVWLLIKRLSFEDCGDTKKLKQLMYDQFLYDVELRVHKEGVRVRVSQKLEDLERKFYGRCLAYDRALEKDANETLSTALLRNVYEDDREKAMASRILERYLRRERECLKMTEAEAVLQGRIRFTRV